MRRHRRVVAVVGSGIAIDPRCDALGRLIATLGVDLLTGGGQGVMEAVSRAFFETSPRRGLVIGIIPGDVGAFAASAPEEEPASEPKVKSRAGYPNPWVELAIQTHLPDTGERGAFPSSRNHIVVLSADAIVALPGRSGTWSEMCLALRYGVPVVAFGDHDRLPEGIPSARTLDDVRAFLDGVIS